MSKHLDLLGDTLSRRPILSLKRMSRRTMNEYRPWHG
jgi:hypothetical protein